jgi:hypothetical protein
MLKTMRHVLKADEVAFDDPLHLSIDPAPQPCEGQPRISAAPSVRIAESHPEYAVIEVACPCGRTTHVRCEYASANPSLASRPVA